MLLNWISSNDKKHIPHNRLNMCILVTALVSITIIVIIACIPRVKERFSIQFDTGIPLTLLDTVKPKEQVYFTELSKQNIINLVKSASPSTSIVDFVQKLNNNLPMYDSFTYKTPYRLVRANTVDGATNVYQIVIYREGKMYGFVVNYVPNSKLSKPIGFILEQDIRMIQGTSEPSYKNYDIKNDSVVHSTADIEAILHQQAQAIFEDRGLKAASF